MGDGRGELDRETKRYASPVARRALTRREFLARSCVAAGGALAASAAAACGGTEGPSAAEEEPPATTATPAAPAEKFTGTLRILGLGEDESILKQAEKDLGFTIAFEAVDALT